MPYHLSVVSLLIFSLSFCPAGNAQTTDPNARARLARSLSDVDSILKTEKYKDVSLMADTLLVQVKALVGEATLDTLYAQTLHTCGRILYYNGKYDLAIARHEECLLIREQMHGKESLPAAISLSNIGICWYEQKKYLKAIEYQQKALLIYQKQKKPWLPALADCWNNLANAQADNGQNEIALESYDNALRIRAYNEGANSLGVASIYQNAAGCYISLNDIAGAIREYQAALGIYREKTKVRPISEAHAWHNLGLCCTFTGDLDYALYCNEQALALRKQNLSADHPQILISLRGLGNTYRRMGDFDRANNYFNTVLESRRKTLKLGDPQLSNSISDVSIAARQSRDWARAEKLALEVIEIERAKPEIDSLATARFISNYGNLLLEMKGPDTALVLYRQAFYWYPKNKTAETGIANCYTVLGECYLQKKDFILADSFIRLAYDILNSPVKKNVAELAASIHQLATIKMLQGQYALSDSLLSNIFTLLEIEAVDTVHWGKVRAPLQLAHALITRARLHHQWAIAEADLQGHHNALYWGGTALSFISNWETKLALSSSKNDTRKIAREAREVCTDAAYYLKRLDPNNREKWLQSAFWHIESAHNSQLRDALIESRTRQVTDLPDPEKERMYQLKLQIVNLEKQIYLFRQSAMNESNDSLLNAVLQLHEKKQALDQLKLESVLPASSKHQAVLPSEVQAKLLRPKQALLEYMVTADSNIYIFWANSSGHDLVKVRLDFDLNKSVEQLRQGITGLHTLSLDDARQRDTSYINSTLHDYIEAACLLKAKIVNPVEEFIKNEIDWLIVPDGILQLVPFNVLLHAPPKFIEDFGSYQFLALDKNIGQAFSVVLQQEMCLTRQKGAEPSNPALILAPFYTGDPAVLTKGSTINKNRFNSDPLPFSGPEAYSVSNQLGNGRVLYGKDATLEVFCKHAPDTRILHLSTHAAANGRFGQYCFIAFAKKGEAYERLYVSDIFRLKIKADLVTLSACESALGELHPGEGLLGLTYVFAQVGAKSIVSSFWQVNDASTSDLMASFYENMTRGGMTKDRALGTTTRAYLEDLGRSNESKHPFFWAAFNVIGDQSPLK
jgi:CHAT domain-containing protein/Tfp pilus assembly protein PilF